MRKLKPIDYKLLFELMKDSHRSDRKLAKALGVSQPTVTRRRAMLEEDLIEGYTITAKLGKIGYEFVAFTFMKSRLNNGHERDEAIKKFTEAYMKQSNVIVALDGRGMGWDALCVSLHKNYSDYAQFIRNHNSELADLITESQSFTADLNPEIVTKPFSLKYLATPE